MRRRFVKWLQHPRAPWVAVALGVLLATPSLSGGLAADDHYHKLVLTHSRGLPGMLESPWQMFVFATGDPRDTRPMMDVGILGWWADASARVAYWRPISVITHIIDYTLWPDTPWLMHLHSLLWWAVVLGVVSLVYRRFGTSPWIGTLALLLYAVDDAHGLTISWLANRNALVAVALALPVLLLHDTWRRRREAKYGVAAVSMLLVALQAGESALAITAFLFAYSVHIERGQWRVRLGVLLPYAVAVVLWRAVYSLAGFGAKGSGLVTDPGRQPVAFLGKLLERMPVLLSAQLGVPPSDLWEFWPILADWLPVVVMAWCLVFLAAVLWLAWPVLRERAAARFWGTALLLATVPLCAQFPHDRLLLFIGVAGMGFMAEVLGAMFQPNDFATPSKPALRRFVWGGLVFLHLVVAPLAFPFRVQGSADVQRMLDRADAGIPDSPQVRNKTVVLVNPPADAFSGSIPMMRAAQDRPWPKHLRWLGTGSTALVIERLDRRTLRVRAEEGFLSQASELMMRSLENPFHEGQVIELPMMRVTITEVLPDGRPREMRARFPVPLESSKLVWLEWRDNAYRSWQPPEVGETVRIPRVDFTKLMD